MMILNIASQKAEVILILYKNKESHRETETKYNNVKIITRVHNK